MSSRLNVRYLGQQAYSLVWQAMQEFTQNRNETTADECWFVEHDPVFTLGQAGKPEHILQHSDIPVIKSDRGGQVTYHGPGQLIMYCLIDLKRHNISIKQLVSGLETMIIAVLTGYGVNAKVLEGAPGVYVNGAKIASIGLRVRKGCTYHGISLNLQMDLAPFRLINPCGYADLAMTQLSDLTETTFTMEDIQQKLVLQMQSFLA